jgi:hypothetical protein
MEKKEKSGQSSLDGNVRNFTRYPPLELRAQGRTTAIEGVTFRNILEQDGTVKLSSVHLGHFFT